MNEWKFSGYFALMTPEYLQVVDKEKYIFGVTLAFMSDYTSNNGFINQDNNQHII